MDYIYLGEDAYGVSRFEDREIGFAQQDFAPPGPPMGVSAAIAAARLLYLELPPGWSDAQHRSPRRQIGLCLSGRMEVTDGTGATRNVEPGGIWEMHDVTGKGHASRVVGDAPCRLAIVQLE